MSAVPSDSALLDAVVTHGWAIYPPQDAGFWMVYEYDDRVGFATNLRAALIMAYVRTNHET
jgi:hypothetical protein